MYRVEFRKKTEGEWQRYECADCLWTAERNLREFTSYYSVWMRSQGEVRIVFIFSDCTKTVVQQDGR